MTEAAWAASRTKGTYLSTKYHKIAARRGKKRAIVAVGHSILIIAYHILKDNVRYKDLGADYVDEKKRQAKIAYYRQALQELEADNREKQSA